MDEKLKNIFANIFGIEANDINENTTQQTVPNWDSLKHMKLVLAIEEEFDVQFDEDVFFELLSFTAIKSELQKLSNDDK